MAQQLHGNTSLFDPSRGVILRGEIHLMSDGKGRSEIHVTNDVTGIMEHLVFTSGQTWIPVLHLIQAIQDTHTDVDLGVTVIDIADGACACCDGVGECIDDEGNWQRCEQCGGRI